MRINKLKLYLEKLPRGIMSLMAIIFFLIINGCSDNLPVTTLSPAHPDSWTDINSPDFHGAVALSIGMPGCATCHGKDWQGGKSGVSCVECHLQKVVCTACHGGFGNSSPAPPYGLNGETSDTTRAVGAHSKHLDGGLYSDGIECRACHLEPLSLLSSEHLDLDLVNRTPVDSIAEITWQSFADGGSAVWNRTDRTCSGTYCHGNFTGGNADNKPIWTAVNQAACGSCHNTGSQPSDLGSPHDFHASVAGLECYHCHGTVVDSLMVIIDKSLHINGTADLFADDSTLCDNCHGSGPGVCTNCHGGTDNTTGAPPSGLRGETATSQLAIGAHTTHMEGSYVSDAFTCDNCHKVPTSVIDSGHLEADSVAEITWGTLAGNEASWDRNTATCSDTYCHGNFAGGDQANAPIWTGPAQALCGSCHDDGSNPENLSGKHKKHIADEGFRCRECHATVVDNLSNIIGKALHVNGNRDISFWLGQGSFQDSTCSGLHNDCHNSKNWYD